MEAAVIQLREQERAVLEALQMERDDARAMKDSVHHSNSRSTKLSVEMRPAA